MRSTSTYAVLLGAFAGAFGSILVFVYITPEHCAVFSRTDQQRIQTDAVCDPCPLPGAGRFAWKPLPITPMVSFPGSGTRWTRYLLTTASGILPGAIPTNVMGVPIMSARIARRVICIQTHTTYKSSQQKLFEPIDRSLVLVRSPYEAILSNFNRLGDVAGGYYLKSFSSKKRFEEKWSQYVTQSMAEWPELYKSWAASDAPLHVLVYSRLKSDLRRELGNAFQFLKINVSSTFECAMRSPEGKDHRQKQSWQDEVAVFSQEQILFLNNAIDEVQAALEQKTGASLDDFQAWKR